MIWPFFGQLMVIVDPSDVATMVPFAAVEYAFAPDFSIASSVCWCGCP